MRGPRLKPLAIIPVYLTASEDLQILLQCIESFRRTTPAEECDLVCVDDGSPVDDYVSALGSTQETHGFELQRSQENQGFARTVNIGLSRAREEGRDAVLVNADLEFIDGGWLKLMQKQQRFDGKGLASVIGARLLYPNGLIQHAGIYFSLLHREFDHNFKYGAYNLPEANVARTCLVTGALQFIRHECLTGVGIYDPEFRMGWEDVDYGLRVWQSGRENVYQPAVKAYHYESIFRSKPGKKLQQWQNESYALLMKKWGDTDVAALCAPVM